VSDRQDTLFPDTRKELPVLNRAHSVCRGQVRQWQCSHITKLLEKMAEEMQRRREI